MARTVWDDIADDGKSDEQPTHAQGGGPPPIPGGPNKKKEDERKEHDVGVRLDIGDAGPTELGDADAALDAGPGAASGGRALARAGWWLAGLLGAGLVTLGAHHLHRSAQTKAALSAARDEAADARRAMLLAEDRATKAEDARANESKKLTTTVAAHDAERETTDKLIADLSSQVDTKDGEVSRDAGQVRVDLVDQILFKSGEADLSPNGKKVLDKVGGVLKTISDRQILVGGHTDKRAIHTAQFPSNWELSAARAVNVVRYLQDTVGVDPAKLAAAGFGEFHPRSKNLAKNRRIEILLTPIVAVKK